MKDVLKLKMYESGLTQCSLAELIGVSPSRLSDYMSGKCEPTLKIAREIFNHTLSPDRHRLGECLLEVPMQVRCRSEVGGRGG